MLYAPKLDATTLQQGDCIARTAAVDAILQEVHPHYLKADYNCFLVLTQSCDLVRRDGEPCKAPYVTIAAVRPLLRAVQHFGERLLRDNSERRLRFASQDRRDRVRQFVERVLNNNEFQHFYLPPLPGTPISEEK